MNVGIYFLGDDGVIVLVWVIFYDIYHLSNEVVGRVV